MGTQDQLVDISIGLYAEGSEENEERNVGLDAGNGGPEHGDKIVFWTIDNLHIVGLGHLVVVGSNTLDLHDLLLLDIRPAIAKDHGAILRHTLQTLHGPLPSHDDEVAPEFLGTLA